jgi:hypothetical protein|tara:strand:+ start:10230 stop:11744 length:1515 start_codon:yes stop_codon:yes gene_type:complete
MSKSESSNILVWLDQGPYAYINLGIATSLSKLHNFNFYGIVATHQDISFFNNQKNINFNEIIYYPDCYINKSSYDIDYLKKSEEEFGLNLWLDVYGERFFHEHRTNFHKFSKSEILIIVENTIKFFSELIERISPKLIIMQTAGENIANTILYKIAKKLNIKILMVNPTHIHNRVVVSDNLISKEISKDFEKIIGNFNEELQDFGPDYIKNKTLIETIKVQNEFNFDDSNTSEKISHYINRINNDPEPIYQNVGKTKLKMIKSKILTNFETKKRKAFLDKNSIFEIQDKKFLYFPLQTEPEAKILSISPFFSNQLAVIENIARSIPVDFILYVKEHPGQGLKLWRSIEFYKKLIELPNVKLIHPSVNPRDLISQSSCVVSITGSTGFEALFYKKPVILFADEYYDCLSMVTKVDNITSLPTLILKNITSFEFNNKEFNALMNSTNSESISIPYFEIMRDALSLSLIQRKDKNFKLTETYFIDFLKKHKENFELLGIEFKKKLFN